MKVQIRNDYVAAANLWIGSDRACVDDFWVSNNSTLVNNFYVSSESASLLNCIICSESVFTAEFWLLRRISFCYWIVWPTANQFSLPNCAFSRESGFRCRIVYFAANQVFSAEFYCPQRIRFLLLNLCCPQQIRCSLPNGVFCSESGVCCRIVLSAVNQVFAAEFVLSAGNQVLAAELCIMQQIRCSLPNCVVRSESSVRCQICVVRSESVVRYWIVYCVGNQVFSAELCCP